MKNENSAISAEVIQSKCYGSLYPTKNGYVYFTIGKTKIDFSWVPQSIKYEDE